MVETPTIIAPHLLETMAHCIEELKLIRAQQVINQRRIDGVQDELDSIMKYLLQKIVETQNK